MWIKLYARVFVGKGLFSRGVDQQASRFFTYHTMAHCLATGNHKGRRKERNVKSVRCIRILGDLHVPAGSLQPLHVRLAKSDWIVVVRRAPKNADGTIGNVSVRHVS